MTHTTYSITFRPTESTTWVPMALPTEFQNEDDAVTYVLGVRERSAEAKLFGDNGIMIMHLMVDGTTMEEMMNS